MVTSTQPGTQKQDPRTDQAGDAFNADAAVMAPCDLMTSAQNESVRLAAAEALLIVRAEAQAMHFQVQRFENADAQRGKADANARRDAFAEMGRRLRYCV